MSHKICTQILLYFGEKIPIHELESEVFISFILSFYSDNISGAVKGYEVLLNVFMYQRKN